VIGKGEGALGGGGAELMVKLCKYQCTMHIQAAGLMTQAAEWGEES
jgi:hypothetical protein